MELKEEINSRKMNESITQTIKHSLNENKKPKREDFVG